MQAATDTAPITTNIPESMRTERRWCVWSLEKTSTGKLTKVPYRADGQGNASSTDPATWSTFDAAMQAHKVGNYTGIGFMLGEGWAGIDLDDCLSDEMKFTWGSEIVGAFDTYTEISPSGTGVKIYLRGAKPADITGCSKRGFGPDQAGKLECYDHDRFFAVTGDILEGKPSEVRDCNGNFAEFCHNSIGIHQQDTASGADGAPSPELQLRRCLADMLRMDMTDCGDGSRRLYACCCRCVESGLSDEAAIKCIRHYVQVYPFPTTWTDADIYSRMADARKRTKSDPTKIETPLPSIIPAGQLCKDFPELKPVVIDHMLRETETANLIASSKANKTHTAIDLALSVATGRCWLNTYTVKRGRVLYIDCELHQNTLARRIAAIAKARGILGEGFADTLHLLSMRSKLRDLFQLRPLFTGIERGTYILIVLDALYRLLPEGIDENSNADVTRLYNAIDQYGEMTGAAIVVVHHATKGIQAGKQVTDVGSGAGAQSRAADTHIVLRPHEENDVVVMESACRSFAPAKSLCLRWIYPTWTVDPDLDPELLREGRKKKVQPEAEPGIDWTPARFVESFITHNPQNHSVILARAGVAKLSDRKAKQLMQLAVVEGLIHRWEPPRKNQPVRYATTPQPVTDTGGGR